MCLLTKLKNLLWHSPSRNLKIIIPARVNSQRLPNKVSMLIANRPMVWHVYQACIRAGFNETEVVVAIDSPSLAKTLNDYGVPTILTSTEHQSGTDRVMEAASKLDLPNDCLVVNIQGDEPEISPVLINQLIHEALCNDSDITTLKTVIDYDSDSSNVNVVKVVMGMDNNAMYFSRADIPYQRNPITTGRQYRHIGVYAYTVKALAQYTSLPPSFLEVTEGLEQLRALENGMTISAPTAYVTPHHGVDTLEDFNRVKQRMERCNG